MSHKLITFPEFYMMLNTSWDPGNHSRGLDLQQAFIHHLHSAPTVPPLITVLWIKPQANKLFYNSKVDTVHSIYSNAINNVKAR